MYSPGQAQRGRRFSRNTPLVSWFREPSNQKEAVPSIRNCLFDSCLENLIPYHSRPLRIGTSFDSAGGDKRHCRSNITFFVSTNPRAESLRACPACSTRRYFVIWILSNFRTLLHLSIDEPRSHHGRHDQATRKIHPCPRTQ